MRVIDDIAFVFFVLSVAMMESESIIIPLSCCICSSFYFLWRGRKKATCKVCGGDHRAGELVGGICHGCREEEQLKSHCYAGLETVKK